MHRRRAASKPQDGDPPAAVLSLSPRAALSDRRRVLPLVEEHQRAGVETEAIQAFAELLQTVFERIAVTVAAYFELGGEMFDAAPRQGLTDQQIDAPAADRVLAIDRRHAGRLGLDLGAAVTPEGCKRTIDHPVQPRRDDELGGSLGIRLTPEHPLGIRLPEGGKSVEQVVPEQATVLSDVGAGTDGQEGKNASVGR